MRLWECTLHIQNTTTHDTLSLAGLKHHAPLSFVKLCILPSDDLCHLWS